MSDQNLFYTPSFYIGMAALLISIFNICLAERREKKRRSERDDDRTNNIRLEEFRSAVRDPVRAKLQGVSDLVKSLKIYSTISCSLSEHADDLKDLNVKATQVIGDLFDALQDANNSGFAAGQAWTDGLTEIEDSTAEKFNYVLNNDMPLNQRFVEIATIATDLTKLKDKINAKLDAELSSEN